jgi:hypothetical protein
LPISSFLFLSNFYWNLQPKTSWSTAIKHIRLLLILFTISQWVYQMIIQAHLGIIMALRMSCWAKGKGISKLLARRFAD